MARVAPEKRFRHRLPIHFDEQLDEVVMGLKIDTKIHGIMEEDREAPELQVIFHSVSDCLIIKQGESYVALYPSQISELRKIIDRIDDD